MPKLLHEIRDPIHNFIRFDSDERRLLDSRPMQRLKHIHQLAMSYLVYPGATHCRFEHSLGVMELAGRVFDLVRPFSFDLRDELARLRAYGYLDLSPEPPYGPSLEVTKIGEDLLENFPTTTKKYEKQIDFVAKQFGTKGVTDLEKFATAFYVTKSCKFKSLERRSQEVNRLKPHVSVPDAIAATKAIDKIIASAKSV
jgi:hypothetical protein